MRIPSLDFALRAILTDVPIRSRRIGLCSAKEKYPKETRPDGLPATRVPCASRDFERSPDSQHLPRLRLANSARQGGSLALKIPAMLGCANGGWWVPPLSRCTHRVPQPTREQARALFEASFMGPACRAYKTPSCARPRSGEERRASAPADECSGCPSLWVLSLGQARESTSPCRAK
jgi:hypothetical protein